MWASSPLLEPEKALSCLGEAIPALIYPRTKGQISSVRPPSSTSQGVGSLPIHRLMAGTDPDCPAYAVAFDYSSKPTVPSLTPSDSVR